MAEASSMSETEGRTASLPPPPSERLPDLPAIFVSDTEAHRKQHNRKPKRKHTTISGVTADAHKVLDALLKRSLSSDANPPQSDSSGGLPERPPPLYHYPSYHHPSRSESYRHKITEQLLLEKMTQLEMSLSEGGQEPHGFEEPDYVYPQEIRRKTHALAVARTKSMKSGSRSHSPNERHRQSCPHERGQLVQYLLEDEDSSSTEDYEYTDPNEFLRRKKKSFFRRATERLMHSFRRRKEHPLDFAEIDSPHNELSPTHHNKKKKKGPSTLSSPFKNLSKKSSKGGSPCEVHDEPELRDLYIERDSLRNGSVSPDGATHYTDIEQFHQESLKRKTQSPSLWKKSKLKEGHLSDGGRDKGLFDNFIRSIKKRGSFRMKRKDSHKGDPTARCCTSAENLTSCTRPLTKEQDRLLQQYANPRSLDRGGVGSDSEFLLHEQKLLVRELCSKTEDCSTTSLPRDGHRLLRERMQLEGLLQAAGPQKLAEALNEPDYDEIQDEDVVDGFPLCGLLKGEAPKPFTERTEDEKEVIYEKIACQLALIADHYNMGCSTSPKQSPTEQFPPELLLESSGSSELEGAAASRRPRSVTFNDTLKSSSDDDKMIRQPSDLEKQLAALLRDKGDHANEEFQDVTPVVEEMIRTASYSKFKQIVNANIGSEPGWHQIAKMFKLTQTAVGLAGMGTYAALQIRKNTMKYFEDKFANWIVSQGGWESMVEEDSELD